MNQPQRNNAFLQLIDCNEYKYMFHKYDKNNRTFKEDYKELVDKARKAVYDAKLSLDLEKILIDYVDYVEFYMDYVPTYIESPSCNLEFYNLFTKPFLDHITPNSNILTEELNEIVTLNTVKEIDFQFNYKEGLEFDSIKCFSRLYTTPIIIALKHLIKNLCKNNCNELIITIGNQIDKEYNRWTVINIDTDVKLDPNVKYRVKDDLYEYAQSFYVNNVDLLRRWTATESSNSIQIIIPR